MILSWSFARLYRGVHPDVDPWGAKYPRSSPAGRRALSPLAGGYYDVVWNIRGGLEFYAKSLKLENYSYATPCGMCP